MSEYNERESGPLESHLKSLIQKLTEVREELADQENNYRIVPLSHEDSGVVLSVCVPECPIPVASDETRSFLDSLWKLSPRTSRPRTSRKDVTAAWKSIPAKDRPTHDEALAAYLAWTKCEAWTKENGQYVCGLHLWIRKRQWENVPEGATPGATPGAGCRKLSNEKGF
jgi:hypothetical protein